MRLRLGLLLLVLLAGCGSGGGGTPAAPPAARTPSPGPGAALDLGTAPSPLSVRLDDPRDTVDPRFRHPPAAGLLFDVDTGRVLWRRRPTARRPIASLTKMMTALVVDNRVQPGTRLRVTQHALDTTGSAVGLFKKGMRVDVRVLLYGLLLPSGNDAARILAEGAAGSITRFVRRMNAYAAVLGLRCSRFATPSGLEDRGNHSCAADLAAVARAVLRRPRLAKIVASRAKVLPLKRVKGHKLFLSNHNPLLFEGYPGVTGVKTGFTDAAGACFVATAARGAVKLGVVLLDSPDIERQSKKLLELGFDEELR